jgi:general secretion pathway protein L
MSQTTLILLPSLATAPALRLGVDGQGAITSRETLPVDGAPSGGIGPCVLAVPAADVGLHRLRLRASTPAQAVAAAARLVESRLSVPHAALHVAVSEASADDERWVAVVDPARMKAWLERAAQLGCLPTAVVPDCLLLAAPNAGAWRVCQGESTWRVRGETGAFSAEPGLAQAILEAQGAAGAAILWATDADLAAGVAAGPVAIDLQQQGFSRHPAAPEGWAAWRTAALLAALVLALIPLGFAAQSLRHSLAAKSIHAAAEAQLQATADFPASPGTPFARANTALAEARAHDAFAITTGALFEALAPLPGAGVSRLDYGEDGLLAASIDHDQPGDIEQLTARLAERGVSASLDATQPSGGRLRSVLLLGVSP